MSQETILKVKCDRCGIVAEVLYYENTGMESNFPSLQRPILPKGWGFVQDSRKRDLCPECAKSYDEFMSTPPKTLFDSEPDKKEDQ